MPRRHGQGQRGTEPGRRNTQDPRSEHMTHRSPTQSQPREQAHHARYETRHGLDSLLRCKYLPRDIDRADRKRIAKRHAMYSLDRSGTGLAKTRNRKASAFPASAGCHRHRPWTRWASPRTGQARALLKKDPARPVPSLRQRDATVTGPGRAAWPTLQPERGIFWPPPSARAPRIGRRAVKGSGPSFWSRAPACRTIPVLVLLSGIV